MLEELQEITYYIANCFIINFQKALAQNSLPQFLKN